MRYYLSNKSVQKVFKRKNIKIISSNYCTNKKNNFSIKTKKDLLKEYGVLGAIVYSGISITCLSSFYFLFKTKRLDTIILIEKMQEFGLEKMVNIEKMKNLSQTEGANLAMAVVCNKLILPFRLPFTVFLVYSIKKLIKKYY